MLRHLLPQVRPDERWEALKPHLDKIGVGLVVTEELDQMEVVFNEMANTSAASRSRGCSTCRA
jgi:hypothetical protein